MTDSIYNELRVIRSRIESIERGQVVLIRAERKAILAEVLPYFTKDATLANVYLLVDGQRGQKQIAEAMAAAGLTGGSDATVSRKLDILRELDLVARDDRTSAGIIYRKTEFDRALHLSREVEKTLQEGGQAK